MGEVTTPRELAERLDISPEALRKALRRRGLTKAGTRWQITSELAAEIEASYRRPRTPLPCPVEGCERQAGARSGLCRIHARRLRRNGDLERRDGAEHQRAKTHCPKGHVHPAEHLPLLRRPVPVPELGRCGRISFSDKKVICSKFIGNRGRLNSPRTSG